MDRRRFLQTTGALAATTALGCATGAPRHPERRPNLVYVFADQWRAQAFGHTGDPNATTPNIDRLAGSSLNFTHAVSGCPVCCAYRGSLMTGQYWLTHGVFLNDVPLSNAATSFAQALGAGGYDTAYIGKWHLDGHGRTSYIPRERRQGFDYWKVLECTHDYNNSYYFADEDVRLQWEGYDAIAQTRDAQAYIRDHRRDRPFALFLSWGPPHDPYETAPEAYRSQHRPEDVQLRPNVPPERAPIAREQLAGYYAHAHALDDCVGDLLATLVECGLEDETIFVFTSDHGDMLYSQGRVKKQQPWEESLRVPFFLRYPLLPKPCREVDTLLNTPDIMPTLLGLCDVRIPASVEGTSFSSSLFAGETPEVAAALYTCVAPFGQWQRKDGGRECRGLRTQRHTYVRDLEGPWLLYDNERDPYQLDNLCGQAKHAKLQADLDHRLTRMLEARGDEFLPADVYIRRWGYQVDETGTVRYTA